MAQSLELFLDARSKNSMVWRTVPRVLPRRVHSARVSDRGGQLRLYNREHHDRSAVNPEAHPRLRRRKEDIHTVKLRMWSFGHLLVRVAVLCAHAAQQVYIFIIPQRVAVTPLALDLVCRGTSQRCSFLGEHAQAFPTDGAMRRCNVDLDAKPWNEAKDVLATFDDHPFDYTLQLWIMGVLDLCCALKCAPASSAPSIRRLYGVREDPSPVPRSRVGTTDSLHQALNTCSRLLPDFLDTAALASAIENVGGNDDTDAIRRTLAVAAPIIVAAHLQLAKPRMRQPGNYTVAIQA